MAQDFQEVSSLGLVAIKREDACQNMDAECRLLRLLCLQLMSQFRLFLNRGVLHLIGLGDYHFFEGTISDLEGP